MPFIQSDITRDEALIAIRALMDAAHDRSYAAASRLIYGHCLLTAFDMHAAALTASKPVLCEQGDAIDLGIRYGGLMLRVAAPRDFCLTQPHGALLLRVLTELNFYEADFWPGLNLLDGDLAGQTYDGRALYEFESADGQARCLLLARREGGVAVDVGALVATLGQFVEMHANAYYDGDLEMTYEGARRIVAPDSDPAWLWTRLDMIFDVEKDD